jgi:2-keto-4-pentenoate hydratase/2-oxohepta-3-ene-1,7-dioic acid hydratase in catechol pathway
MKFSLPTYPELFLKPATTISGPASTITLPRGSGTDYEVELAIVIGKRCKDVSRANALDYILGYTIANDLTARDVQKRGSQWSYCKSFDGFCPLGPALVSAEQIPDPSVLEVSSTLNGKTMQKQLVSDMIFSIPEIVEYLSNGSTLEPGTVILTGTPAGIGASKVPPAFLKKGDDLKISISHGLGSLVNQFVGEESS